MMQLSFGMHVICCDGHDVCSLLEAFREAETTEGTAVIIAHTIKGKGISFMDEISGVRHNNSYFPIFIDAEEYGMSRDEVYFKMKEKGVLGRRYFYPLISTFSTYRGLASATPDNLPVATQKANEIICLPMHPNLSDEDIERILSIIID